MVKTKIHFVCRGNIFRSKLAEAYAKSLKMPGLEISSSGVDPMFDWPGGIEYSARVLGKRNGITSWFEKSINKTSQKVLDENDIIVFMREDVYSEAKKSYKINDGKSLVWHVRDGKDWHHKLPIAKKRLLTFKLIKRNVDALVKSIYVAGRVDIVDENNQKLGFSLPVEIASKKGLWIRGCHGIVTTPDNRIVIQKRSSTILFSPNLIEVTLGGYVDAGETPDQAMAREISEELGLKVAKNSLKLLDIHKKVSYHPRHKRHSRAFVYSYHIKLKENNPKFNLQPSESAAVKVISKRQLNSLIKNRKLRNFGRLDYEYAYYRHVAEQIIE